MWLAVPLPDGSIGGACARAAGDWTLGLPFPRGSTPCGRLRLALTPGAPARRELLQAVAADVELAIQAPDATAPQVHRGADNDGQATVWAAGDGFRRPAPRTDSWDTHVLDGYWAAPMAWAAELPGQRRHPCRVAESGPVRHARQLADGMLPTRFARMVPSKRNSRAQSRRKPARWSSSCELYRQDRNPQYLDAAKKGLDFLEQEVLLAVSGTTTRPFGAAVRVGRNSMNVRNSGRPTTWPSRRPFAAYLAAFRLTASRVTWYGRSLAGLPPAVSAVLDESRAGTT